MTWSERYPEYCSMIEAALPQYLPPVTLPQGKVCEAMAWRETHPRVPDAGDVRAVRRRGAVGVAAGLCR